MTRGYRWARVKTSGRGSNSHTPLKNRVIAGIVPDVDIGPRGVNLDKLKAWARRLAPKLDLVDLKWDEFENMLQSQSIADIRYKLVSLLKNVFRFIKYYSFLFKKVFYAVSLVMVIVDAFQYLRKYTSDGQFDNKYVDDNLRKLWRDDPSREKLTPIRHWEVEEKYQVSKSIGLTKKESKRILIKSIPTLLFATMTLFTLIADYALVSLLEAVLTHGQFGISFKGMEKGVQLGDLFGEIATGHRDFVSLKLEAFDLSTDPCLPRATRTGYADVGLLCGIVVVSALSCIFDAYASRWRAQICNIFYEKRAVQRAEHLYRRIKAGRGSRKFQIRHVIIREMERRNNLENFAWWSRAKAKVNIRWWGRKAFKCPACGWKVKKEDCVEVKVNDIKADICNDCHQDF